MAPWILACLLAAQAQGVPTLAPASRVGAPAGDPVARAEALAAQGPRSGWASPWAYAGYLQARLALEHGDLAAARAGLRAARIHDPASPLLSAELQAVEARLASPDPEP